MRYLALYLVLVSISELSAQSTVAKSKMPAWVTEYQYVDISGTTETNNGYVYLLISRQSHLETGEDYYKYVMKVTSEKGLTVVGSVNESFDPSFQKLTFHELNITRDGRKIDRLDPAKFEVIRREEEMDRAVYDKSVNAVYNLPDVRVGDIVEYAFTRKGFNPAFGNHSFGKFYLQFETPVAKFAYRIVRDQNRLLQIKTFGETSASHSETQEGRMRATEWISENAEALLTDDNYPSWFDPFPRVEFSDFKSWNDVKEWARNLYRLPELQKGDLGNAIQTIRSSEKSDDDKIRECIRIAQGDIRYLSFSDGIHGYKPHSPETVFDQRYGDCKDKSFMLALMLNQLGFESHPALVSTELGYILPDVVPSPWAFNHCIVQFTHNDSTYWIDPTLKAQVGALKEYYIPSYHHALVINSDSSGLAAIPFGYKRSKIDIKEEYSMDEVGGYVTLKVQTTYYGDEADGIRSYYGSRTTDRINKDYMNFYADDYSEISVSKDFEYTDDRENNIVVASEEYLLKNFWTIAEGNKTADVFASVLYTYLKKPETRVRTMPLSIVHPRDISQTIKIRLPEDWNVEDSHLKIESEGFTYSRSKFYADQVITLRYNYRTKASFVSAEAAGDHIDKISEAQDDTGLTIYKPLAGSTSQNRNAYIIVALLIVVGVIVVKKQLGK